MSPSFLDILNRKVLVFDGAMGTSLQSQNLSGEDFGGKDGCNEYLVLTKPDAVKKVHEGFLKAGCDAVETNTFGANRLILAEYGLGDKVPEINKKAAQLAREATNRYSSPDHPRFAIGSVGPGTKLPSLGHISYDELIPVYKEQIQGLIEGGVDGLLIETCQDLLQAKIAVIAASECFLEAGKRLPLLTQVTFAQAGTMLLGTEMGAVISTLEMLPVDVIGMNCATGPKEMIEHLRFLSENSVKPVSASPNAGLPENIGGIAHYRLTPVELAEYLEYFVKEFGVSVVGGCCGTTPDHLEEVVKRVSGLTPKRRRPVHNASCASLYSSVNYAQDIPPLLVGEQTNANGSRKFRQILEGDDYDGLVSRAREAVKEGAHLIDVSVAYVGRNEVKDMMETITRFNQQIPLPLMIDSTEIPVIEAALKHIGGKPIINSINLEDGEERMEKVCALAKKFGAGLIALTIDEEGMAKTRDKKFEVAKRIYALATQKYGLSSEEIFFDPLTFSLASGEEFQGAAIETLEAIRLIKANLPGARTILGLSNISFGLAPYSRPILNSVFLHDAVQAGLDAAIVHAKKILPLHKIPEEEILLTRRLLYNQWVDSKNPLEEFIVHFEKTKGVGIKQKIKKKAVSVEESLKNRIIDGEKENLEKDLDRALKKYAPLDIINDILLPGMKVVGDLFGEGRMQLPFVLQSAEVMKRAAAYLETFMEKAKGEKKGTIVLATVRGDVHDIGKNLVDILLTNNGYKVINLGIKQPVDQILKAAEEHRPVAIGLSGLLVKSTLVMKEDLEEMNRRRITLPVICGGAALTRKYVEEDLAGLYEGQVFYGQDAFTGLRVMDQLTSPNQAAADKANKTRGKSMAAVPEAAALPPPKRSGIANDNPVPKPPFWGYRIMKNIPIEDVFPWINKISLFRAQWQYKKGRLSPAEYEKTIQETAEPLYRNLQKLCAREKILTPLAIYGYYPCYSEGNDLVVLDESGKREKIRFSFPRQKKEPYLCLSDFFRPKASGELDLIGVQAVTVGGQASAREKELFEKDEYADYLHLHGLAVEAAEGLAEYVHAMIRRELGLAAADSPVIEEIFRQGYQGSRYSFGYPACPHVEDQVKLFKLIPAEEIGLTLTEEYQMVPEQSTSAIVVHHPKAKYFNV